MTNYFYSKAKDYATGRPSYPVELLDKLRELGINESSKIADIGAGTGLLTRVLGELHCSVVAIEPNVEMLAECQNYCADLKQIEYCNASAEQTTLDEKSIDLITVAQAFHWFDKTLCKIEFTRILKKHGYVLTVWNELQEDNDFVTAYRQIVSQYEMKTTAGNAYFDPDAEKLNFFGQDFEKVYFDNYQLATFDEVTANAASFSYMPSAHDPQYTPMVQQLEAAFKKHAVEGLVTFHYKTEVSIGQFKSE